jgi:hypothetical protein
MRAFKGSLLVVALASGNHRRKADDEHLRGETAVTVGRPIERGKGKEVKLRRTSTSPGRCCRSRPGQRRHDGDGIVDFFAGGRGGIGERVIDTGCSGSIPCTRMCSSTRRFSWHSRFGAGSTEAVGR